MYSVQYFECTKHHNILILSEGNDLRDRRKPLSRIGLWRIEVESCLHNSGRQVVREGALHHYPSFIADGNSRDISLVGEISQGVSRRRKEPTHPIPSLIALIKSSYMLLIHCVPMLQQYIVDVERPDFVMRGHASSASKELDGMS